MTWEIQQVLTATLMDYGRADELQCGLLDSSLSLHKVV